ncbi:SpoIIAA-like [Cognatiyoonia koreensis]|uniref:SpoIIAA-like n=1 Tax=Cognatiyoonia koreensis TaxID=364200 RepID=A0A1I0RZH2_9RHOB|nr:STAS/SEC14 domain-containing protein [Cognatiyoonia koreensis]SEW47130.1 SpoIIAA-like [Cognatiyoonia koreensis]
MLKVTKTGANRLNITLEGTLDSDKMRTGLDHMAELSQDINAGRMLYRIKNFHMPTLGAIGVEFSYLPKLFSLIGRFDKCAVCSDISWIRTAAEVEGALIPGLEIKAFGLKETDAAEAWLDA